jgi:hypothetical protein
MRRTGSGARRAAPALGAAVLEGSRRAPGPARDRRAVRPLGGRAAPRVTLDRDGVGRVVGPLATSPARRHGPDVSTLTQATP